MKIQHVLRLAVLGVTMCAGLAHAQNYQRTYLSNARPLIKFNELQQGEKVVLAEQSQLLLRDLYVHRYQKNEYYGNTPLSGHIDPAVGAADILKKVKSGSLTTTELHQQLSKVFVAQRDLHLNYNFPLPHAAFQTYLPFEFERTSSAADQNEVRISTVFTNRFNDLYYGIRQPAVGDLVIEYDGLPIKQAVQKAVVDGNGANLYAGFSRALQFMTFTWQGSTLPPKNNSVKIKFRAVSNGEEYSIDAPWLVFYDANQVSQPINSGAKAPKTAQALKAKANKALNLSNDPIQERYNKFMAINAPKKTRAIVTTPTAEPSINWAIVNRGKKTVGYISIGTFAPEHPDAYYPSVEIIAGLLRNELASTDALVIDVRNNGGGYISYADMLPQLFMPSKPSTIGARLLNTKLNYNFLNQPIFQYYWPEWVNVITNAQKTRDRYSKTEVFTPASEVNYYGQRYYKPVGVLMNARSYSATDLFTCSMRDNGAAVIYGEDPKTGAGGANVLEQDFFAYYGAEPFQALPGGVSMRVSWRQSVRTGLAAGALIEDQGCNADVQVPRSLSDLSNGDQTQFNKVADSLLARAPSASYFSDLTYSNFVPFGDMISVEPGALNLNLQVANTELVKVYVDDVLVSVQVVRASANPRAVGLSINLASGPRQISIVGTNASHKPLWNTKRFANVSVE